jgi:hypothetical protein
MSRREKNGQMGKIGAVNGTPLPDQLLERISQRAFELYELRGGAHGHDAEDWFEAERQISAEIVTGPGEKE